MTLNDSPPELSRPIFVDRIGHKETVVEIAAEPAECAALADRFAILKVDSVSARLQVRRLRGGLIRVRGALVAEVVQACVVTLEPVAQRVEERFEMLYGDTEPPGGEEIEIDVEADDPPEPIAHGVIDLGEAVAEHLALGLDPFPRRPDAMFEEKADEDDAPPEDDEKTNPFARLAALRRNPD